MHETTRRNYPIYFVNRTVSFSVKGKPFAKERPKAARRGRFIHVYTPKKTKTYEDYVRKTYLNDVGNIRLTGPLEAKVSGIFPVPESTSKVMKQKMLNGDIQHTKKPDCDNMGKIVFDGLNDVAYNDDSAICRTYIDKRYGEDPRIDVTLKELNREIENNRNEQNQCIIFYPKIPIQPIYFTT